MDTELKKKIDEATVAKSDAYLDYCVDNDLLFTVRGDFSNGFKAGAEFGYKEAIAQAKEWLKNNVSNYTATYIVGCSKGEFITEFESDMNKLLEE